MNNEWWIHELIQVNAYYKWQKEGCPQDRDLEFWIEATKEVLDSLKEDYKKSS